MLSAVEMSRLTMAGSRKDLDEALRTVSYTHLTLPTMCVV